MDRHGRMIRQGGFWLFALLWLPAGVVGSSVVRFMQWPGEPAPAQLLMMAISLLPVIPSGLPLALGCRWLWRLQYRRTAWAAGIPLGAVTVAATVVAGLLGPIAIVICAVVLSLPVWIAAWFLNRARKKATD